VGRAGKGTSHRRNDPGGQSKKANILMNIDSPMALQFPNASFTNLPQVTEIGRPRSATATPAARRNPWADGCNEGPVTSIACSVVLALCGLNIAGAFALVFLA
jgi:hypothetical protein